MTTTAVAVAAVATALPDYEIGEEIGRGGFGVVLSGRHRRLGRPVAIKVLSPALVANAQLRSRFVDEARLLASLDHPHLVPVYDYVERDGLCLLIMELLGGGTVWSAFRQRGFSAETSCTVAMVTCAGLHHAHQNGVLHRDVKPGNLLFGTAGQLKLTDFGIAKVLGGSDALLTGEGQIIGTPAYMAPEQAEGKGLSAAVDVYAVGIVLYELLSGYLPFSEEGGGLAITYRHLFEKPRPLLDVAPAVPPRIAHVVMSALARNPAERYDSAEQLGVELAEAAGDAFGPGWLERAEVPLLGGGPIQTTAGRTTQGLLAGADLMRHDSSVATYQMPNRLPTQRPPSQYDLVRPNVSTHVTGRPPRNPDIGVLPVRDVLEMPPWPRQRAYLAGVLAVLALAAAMLGAAVSGGSGGSGRSGTGQVAFAGRLVGSSGVVGADLGAPIPVQVKGIPGAATVRLKITAGGVALAQPTDATLDRAGRGVIDARGSRYLAAGRLDATLQILDGGGTRLQSRTFTLDPARFGLTTVPGGVALAALLAVLAYAESLARPLRQGTNRRTGATVGLTVLGAAFGVVLGLLAWVLGLGVLRAPVLVIAGLLGACAGLVTARTAAAIGARARVRRQLKTREVLDYLSESLRRS